MTGSGRIVQRCGFFVAPIPGHLQEMGLIIPILPCWVAWRRCEGATTETRALPPPTLPG
jgi:hypothetical protein